MQHNVNLNIHYSAPEEGFPFFDETRLFSKKKNRQNFLDLQSKVSAIGLRMPDLSWEDVTSISGFL